MEQTTIPTTRRDFEARRLVTVTLADGSVLLCRRATLRDLIQRGVVSLDLMSAAQLLREAGEAPSADQVARLQIIREGLENIAMFVALDPPLVATRDSANNAAVWVGFLSTEELAQIFDAVSGRQPTGAADPAAFPDAAARPADGAAPDGEGLRPEAEQLDSAGSLAAQHG